MTLGDPLAITFPYQKQHFILILLSSQFWPLKLKLLASKGKNTTVGANKMSIEIQNMTLVLRFYEKRLALIKQDKQLLSDKYFYLSRNVEL